MPPDPPRSVSRLHRSKIPPPTFKRLAPPLRGKVITTNKRYGQRLWLEAWHINMSNHALNRDDSAYLPEEYIHLIGINCNFRSPLMKTLDWSVKTLGLGYNSTGLCNHLVNYLYYTIYMQK